MTPAQIDRLRSIKTLRQLVAYLRDELDWPISSEDTEEITFDYQASELGLDESAAVRIKEIKQLRPLASGQPWGIFFINFENKRLPIVAMRRILRSLALRKRESANKSERQAWKTHDLLFISAYGEADDRALTFAHFVDQPNLNLAELRVLGWDDDDTALKLDYIVRTLGEKLRWQEEFTEDPSLWRKQWSDAFRIRHGHVIRTSAELASALAMLARRLRSRIRSVLRMEAGDGQIRTLQRAFKIGLIHDLNDESFADMFAQTVTYGLFSVSVRRTFPEAGTAVVKEDVPNLIFTSPFLKDMLGVFLGIRSYKGKIDFDELGVSEVTDLLTSPDTHMEVVLADFNNKTRGEDPVIHFYEHFLTAYNKELKIQRGVFYTPQPVVSYIVRSVHELLQTEFGLADGLADTTTWGEMLKKHPGLKLPPLTDESGEKHTISPNEPFVQILDPATGTATFLVEVIDVIFRTLTAKWKQQRLSEAKQSDAWNEYVPKHLLPRLHAFELMMAPYAIAHMKVGLKLSETGYRFATEERARIYLTNALEPKVSQLPQIGFDALAVEAAAVNEIKWYKRFTVVIGNPPYSLYGQLNKIPSILDLLQDYKRGLAEKKVNLDDDFIKFVRQGQEFLATSRVGILGFITNSTYLDGITHRIMRSSLMANFSRILLLDLHGSSKRLEKSPHGHPDENVFDIQTGVAISLLIRGTGLSGIKHSELWGSRENKYRELFASSATTTEFSELTPRAPYFFFCPKNMGAFEEYQAWHPLKSVFIVGGCGIKTERDPVTVCWTRPECQAVIHDFRTQTEGFLRQKYNLGADSRDWTIPKAKVDVKVNTGESLFQKVLYRPFDERHLWYSGQTRGFVGTPSHPTVKHLLLPSNLALLTSRQQAQTGFDHAFCTNKIVDHSVLSTTSREISSAFPLYLSDETLELASNESVGENTKRHNFAPSFLKQLAAVLNINLSGSQNMPAGLTPEDIFHYAYAVFHSPGYRSRYAEFLKIDFPRLPLTSDLKLFRSLARLGGELTALHLLESPKVEKARTEFIGGRNPEVEKISWSKNTVWIDKAQTTGFRGVPEEVWNFHIGGYQVCEKWLKDRKGRTLSKDDLAHYQKVVVALAETIRLMQEIDEVIAAHGGWPGAFATGTATADAKPVAASAKKTPPPDLGLTTEDELPLA